MLFYYTISLVLKLILEFYLTLAIPLIYLLGLLIISSSFTFHFSLLTIPFLIITLLGLFLWLWSHFTLRSSLTVLPQAKKLVTWGPYQYFSHPMYIAITLTFLGLSLASGSKPGLLYTIFIIIPLNIFRARKEEKKLLEEFGKKYQEYKKKVVF